MRERVKRKDERDQQEASRPMTIPIGSETLDASEEFIVARGKTNLYQVISLTGSRTQLSRDVL